MQRKTNPDVHIICGKCGCATMFKYCVSNLINPDNEEDVYVDVTLICKNCSTMTGLDELIDYEKK